ncbi:hypothetical protein D9613_008175 [Agrocybe pediades]|uniref:Uncharacterized protein n=1 Tax=Agrocybe pediades TaxID=84607 RepID=A0A8H4QMV1_9AGAR|nr:hypothetical protein D9613_008175 [Agrocybe pediades]
MVVSPKPLGDRFRLSIIVDIDEEKFVGGDKVQLSSPRTSVTASQVVHRPLKKRQDVVQTFIDNAVKSVIVVLYNVNLSPAGPSRHPLCCGRRIIKSGILLLQSFTLLPPPPPLTQRPIPHNFLCPVTRTRSFHAQVCLILSSICTFYSTSTDSIESSVNLTHNLPYCHFHLLNRNPDIRLIEQQRPPPRSDPKARLPAAPNIDLIMRHRGALDESGGLRLLGVEHEDDQDEEEKRPREPAFCLIRGLRVTTSMTTS